MKDKNQPTPDVIAKTALGGRLDADAPAPLEASALDLTRHQNNANAFLNSLHGFGSKVDGFGRAPEGRRRQRANFAAMPNDAFDALARGLEFSPAFAASAQLSGVEVRDFIEFDRVYSSVRGEVRLFLQALDDTLAEKRSFMGELCSRAAKIGDQLTLKGESQEAVLHLRQILEVFKARRRKTPEVERDVIKKVKEIKRAAAPVHIEVSGSQSPMEPVTAKFKAGRDLEP